jgi:hypothetical protein
VHKEFTDQFGETYHDFYRQHRLISGLPSLVSTVCPLQHNFLPVAPNVFGELVDVASLDLAVWASSPGVVFRELSTLV